MDNYDDMKPILTQLQKSLGALGKNIETLTHVLGGDGKGKRAKAQAAATKGLDDLGKTADTTAKKLKTISVAKKTLEVDLDRFGRHARDAALSVGIASAGMRHFGRVMHLGSEDIIETISHTFTHGLGALFGGAAVGAIIAKGADLYRTYQKLTDVGQTFGGSMLEMAQQAGAAALPLGDFERMLTRNSVVAASLAGMSNSTAQSLGGLQLAVRQNLKGMGFFGMSMEQIASVTGEYAEMVRLSGSSQLQNASNMAAQVTSFTSSVSRFAALTGKSREEIINETMSAMKDVTFEATNMTAAQRESVARTTAFLAAMPGEAGKALSTMLTQTIGRGASYLTDQGREFASVGASQLNAIVQRLADETMQGPLTRAQASQYLADVKAYYQHNKSTLSLLAMSGDQAAAQTLSFLQQQQNIDSDRLYMAMNEKRNTKQFGLMLQDIEQLFGRFREGFYGAIKGMSGLNTTAMFKNLGASFQSAGASVGRVLDAAFNKQNLEGISELLRGLGEVVPPVIEGMAAVGRTLFGFGNMVGDLFGRINKGLGVTATALTVLGTWITGKFLVSLTKDFLADRVSGFLRTYRTRAMSVVAGVVNVNGGGGSGSGGGFGGGGGGEGGGGGGSAEGDLAKKEGWFSKIKRRLGFKGGEGAIRDAEAAASDVEKVEKGGKLGRFVGWIGDAVRAGGSKLLGMAGGAGNLMGDALGVVKDSRFLKPVMGLFAKSLPEAGAVASGVDMAARLAEGDKFGAAIDGASAALDTTGVGSIGSLALQGILALRDTFMPFRRGGASPVTPRQRAPALGEVEAAAEGAAGAGGALGTLGAVARGAATVGEVGMMAELLRTQREIKQLLTELVKHQHAASREQIDVARRSARAQEQSTLMWQVGGGL